MAWGGGVASPSSAPASSPPDLVPTPATLRAAETAKQFIEGLYAVQRRSVADRVCR